MDNNHGWQWVNEGTLNRCTIMFLLGLLWSWVTQQGIRYGIGATRMMAQFKVIFWQQSCPSSQLCFVWRNRAQPCQICMASLNDEFASQKAWPTLFDCSFDSIKFLFNECPIIVGWERRLGLHTEVDANAVGHLPAWGQCQCLVCLHRCAHGMAWTNMDNVTTHQGQWVLQ